VWGTGAAAALVVSAAGVVSVLTPPNFEAQASFTLTAVCVKGLWVNGACVIEGLLLCRCPSWQSTIKSDVCCHLQVVSDGALSVSRGVTVAVTNVNEVPDLGDNMFYSTIDENSAIGTALKSADVCAVNPDAGQTLTYV
jgi:hypothetical protein